MSYTITSHAAEVAVKVNSGSKSGLTAALEHLLEESRRVVPIEEGTLSRSGKVSVTEDGDEGAVSFDGPYAVAQHERLDFKHPNGRQAKYLEQPAHAEKATMTGLVAGAIRAAVK